MNKDKNTYGNPEYLVETEWLEQNLNKPNLRVFDCTVNVKMNPDEVQRRCLPFVYESGIDQYSKAHIPGSGYIDVPGKLSDSNSQLPLMFPNERIVVEQMRNYGINKNSHVVLYSTSEPNWATRVWWMLRSSGFINVSVLNGGWSKWKFEGRPVSIRKCEYTSGNVILKRQHNAFVDKEKVLEGINDKYTRIISALPVGIYEGNSEIMFGRKGRIAKSVNVPFVSLYDSNSGTYLPADLLRKKFDEVDAFDAEHIITYCGGGVAASNCAFALALLGYENVSVYDGSMLEWGCDESLPMELG